MQVGPPLSMDQELTGRLDALRHLRVGRSRPRSRPSDIGAMELYGTPIVGSNPYEVINDLR